MAEIPACRLYIGTSGYSYGEWVDSGFYPDGTPAAHMLDCYIRSFQAVELNYTWYQMPRAPALERMCEKAPQGFRFSVKLTRTMTHEVKKDLWPKEAGRFREGIEPLVRTRRLLCVLIQLPPYFERSPEARNYLAALLDELSGLPLAVEFRHDSWANDRVFAELERRKVSLVNVDEPDLPGLFPGLCAVTHPGLFYLRFHGRNAKGWRSGSMQKQFDYDYSDRELQAWASRIRTELMPGASAGGIFFNNHVRGQAPKNALRLIDLLTREHRGPSPWTAPSFT
jgi:uncharacterized protein YecE (DUF72 family)